MPAPSSQDVLLWVVCFFIVAGVLVKSWSWVTKTVFVTNSLKDLPALVEQVGILASTVESLTKSVKTTSSTIEDTKNNVCALAQQVNRIEEQVANTHPTNLRDDMDMKHADSMRRMESLQTEVEALREQGEVRMHLLASTIERQTDFDKAIARIWEKIDPSPSGGSSE